jgi:hypothetical protein
MLIYIRKYYKIIDISSDPRNSVASRTRSLHQNQLTYFLHNELINMDQN